ncbi:MAG: o-succinylbenzoate synthase [Phycisphaeraceae bacterium]|nr:o-succinylbenzoate synthase [Phycisphaeraceae bacterium]
MRLDRLKIVQVSLPLIRPWRTAYGDHGTVGGVLVNACSEGDDVWVESTPFDHPIFCPESSTSVFFNLRDIFGPHVIGKNFDNTASVINHLSSFRGNPFAKAAIDHCFWALESVKQHKPLHKLLGAERHKVPVGADFEVMDSIDDLLAHIAQAIDIGFPRVKLKVRPGNDTEVIRAVRKAFPDLVFHVDCNGGYSLDSLSTFKEWDRYAMAMVEQPLHHNDILEHAQLQAQIETPVCLDESVKSVRDAELAVRNKACKVINIKPGRVGGLTASKAIHDLCADEGVTCWVGSMLESGVGAGILIELAMLPNFTYPADIFPSTRFYHQDLVSPQIELQDGFYVKASTQPFTGYVPNEDQIAQQTVRSAEITDQS